VSISIRPAIPDDREFVLGLADRLVAFETPTWRTKPELIEGDRRALREWFDGAPKPDQAMLIAEYYGEPAGVAYLVTHVDYFNLRPHAHLSVLAVADGAEGRGIGSMLLDESVEWAKSRKSDRLTLSALVTNARARALYERKGFSGEYIRYVLPLRSG